MKDQVNIFLRIQHDYIGKDHYSWKLFFDGAKNMFAESNGDFGYYIFEDDMLGYRGRYAIHYAGKFYKNQSTSNTKKRVTYLFISSANNSEWWKKNQVRIARRADKTIYLSPQYRIEKYILSPDELSIPSDPNLIDTLHFR